MADYKDILTGTLSSIMEKVKGAADSGAVRSVYEQGSTKAKTYAQLAKYTFELNGDKEELKRVFSEIGRLYFEQTQDAPNEFFAALFEQANTVSARIAEKEEFIRTIKSEFAAKDEDGIEVEVGDFEDVVDATEADGVTVEVRAEEKPEE